MVRVAKLKNGEEIVQDNLFLPEIPSRDNPYPKDHKTHNKWAAMERTRLDLLSLKLEVVEHNNAIDKAIQPPEPTLPPITCTPEEWEQYLKEVDTYRSEMKALGIIGYQTKGRKPFADPSTKKPPRPLTRDKHIKTLIEAGFTVDDTDVNNIVVDDGFGRAFKMLNNGKIELSTGERMPTYKFIYKYTHREL